MKIDRCVCHDTTFAEMKRRADEHGVQTVEGLKRVVCFGSNCGLCRPYVKDMLETGRVEYRTILPDPETMQTSKAE